MSKWAKPHVVPAPVAAAAAVAPEGPAKDPTWYQPICDIVLAKVTRWFEMYERGEESASRPYVTMNGRIVDRVTMYAHRIRFKTQEIDHLVRLLHALAEHQELTVDFTRVRQGMTKLKLVPGGEYEVPLNTFYEHIASVRDKRTKTFYIAFRETADAQLARESDLVKYPEWLMKSNEKQRERMIFIYLVMKHPKDIPIMRSHEDWLAPITDAATFDAVWHFLAQNHSMPAQ